MLGDARGAGWAKWRLPVGYALASLGWIFASDHLVGWLSDDVTTLERLQLAKGVLFVVVSALLLGWLGHRERLAQSALQASTALLVQHGELTSTCEALARSATDARAFGQAVCEEVCRLPGIVSASIRLGRTGEALRGVAHAGLEPERLEEQFRQLSSNPTALAKLKQLFSDAVPFSMRFEDVGLRFEGVGAILVVPLSGPNGVFGTMGIRAASPALFDPPGWQTTGKRLGDILANGFTRLETASQLETFVETAPIEVVLVDGNSKVLVLNAAARTRLGPRATNFRPGTPLVELVGNDAAAGLLRAQDAVRESRRPTTGTLELDGAISETTHVPLIDASNHVTAVATLQRDITGEMRLKDALRALSARARSLREDEQARLSHQLHDNLAQRLTALSLQLRAVEHTISDLPTAPGDLVDAVVEASALADQTVQEVQRISQGLRPATLEALGLPTALVDEAKAFEARTGTTCEVAVDDVGALSPRLATSLFRIAQEALANVGQHANAKRATVRLTRTETDLVLEVTDDGVGLPPAPRPGLDLGLLAMQELATEVGGQLEIAARSTGGTVVNFRVTLGPRA